MGSMLTRENGSGHMIPVRTLEELNEIDFSLIQEDEFWNNGEGKELGIHKVHVYPAKFPSLIAQRSFLYAKKHDMYLNRVADIFCGCGTVAIEARMAGIDFWGCDLNPVAVLLAQAKTSIYDSDRVESIGEQIVEEYREREVLDSYPLANDRLKYWFVPDQYNKLFHLKVIIDEIITEEKYHTLFLCVFSSILKSTSKWLTKSIKPQVDPLKPIHDVLETFQSQLEVFLKAIKETNYCSTAKVKVERANVLNINKRDYVDMIITSPPYVTSYEYADLHQLSSLWLGFTDDYTKLRADSIGSLYNAPKSQEGNLTKTAKCIVDSFNNNSKGRAISRYYSQMFFVINKCFQLLRENGRCVFVIGDTEYKNIKIENARCLAESLLENGFEIELITKRRIGNKFLPSHRDSIGRFSSNSDDRKIYSQEYIIIGRKHICQKSIL